MRAHSFIDSIIDGEGERCPSGIAPGSGRDVVHRHGPLGTRRQLAIKQVQGEHLGRHLMPVFIHPEDIIGKELIEIADVAFVIRIHRCFDQIDERTRRRRSRTAALNRPAFRSRRAAVLGKGHCRRQH